MKFKKQDKTDFLRILIFVFVFISFSQITKAVSVKERVQTFNVLKFGAVGITIFLHRLWAKTGRWSGEASPELRICLMPMRLIAMISNREKAEN